MIRSYSETMDHKGGAMRAFVGIVTAIAVLGIGVQPVSAATGASRPQPVLAAPVANVCHDTDVAKALAGASPGALLADPQDVTSTSQIATGRLYRVLYATDGAAGTVVASCGLIAVPNGASVKGVIAWAHPTIGLKQTCQPSEKPQAFVGKMPNGIGAPTKSQTQQEGALVNMLNDGYAVVATDYPSKGTGSDELQPYVLGVAEGLAVLNSARVLTHHATSFGLIAIAADAELPLITWGHSQGGGSALWAGQLAKQYFESRSDSTLNLVGVAAEAPATQYTTSPGQPASYMGKHLGDRDMYNTTPGLGFPFPIGAALFSYVTAAWSDVKNANVGEYPFGPTSAINYKDVLSADGDDTAPKVANACLDLLNIGSIVLNTEKYIKPNKNRFFAEPFAGSNATGEWVAGIDSTCANSADAAQAIQDWCSWLQFNMPGPYGVNNYAKVPLDNSGHKVPMYLAQGRDDHIMWCVDSVLMVTGPNCLTAQYYSSMMPQYCIGGGHMDVDYFQGISHMTVPGAAATNPKTGNYSGSPLDDFVAGAMAGSLTKWCHIGLPKNPLTQ